MIVEKVFKEFIKVVQENDKFSIGLLNQIGVVLDSSDVTWIGKRCDVQKNDATNRFYPICVKKQEYGYIWLSGDDESLEMMGNLISDSFNIRLAYEITQNMLTQNLTDDDRLIKLLLDENEFDRNQILQLVRSMDFNQQKARLAIYIYNRSGFDSSKVVRLRLIPEGKDTISSLLNKCVLLIYKTVPENLEEQKQEEYICSFLKTLRHYDIAGDQYYVGTMQKKLINYKESYQHCLWLKNHVKEKEEEVIFFRRYQYDYFISQISLEKVSGVFDYYIENCKDLDVDELITISNSLLTNSFNISQTANDLYLHKNTLIYKLKKYEESFQVDIRGDFKGKVMFAIVTSLIKEIQRKRQVGEE